MCHKWDRRLSLVFCDQHIRLIYNTTMFFQKRFTCPDCGALYDNRHSCAGRCRLCDNVSCKKAPLSWKFCGDCHTNYRNAICMAEHLASGRCGKYISCSDCFRTVERAALEEHRGACGLVRCRHCYELQPPDHLCTVKRGGDKAALGTADWRLVFYDYETFVSPFGWLEPYCVVAARVCPYCINDADAEHCGNCGDRFHEFYGDDVPKFHRWLLEDPAHIKHHTIAVAHNASKFDAMFVLQWMVSVNRRPDKISFRGNQLLQMKVGNVHFKDSYLFVKAALNKFPKMFGFAGAKGHFPWRFAAVQTLNYTGAIPDKRYFGLARMSEAQRAEFEQWYCDNEEDYYDFKKECLQYCRMDVKILMEGMLAFRKTCLELTRGAADPLLGNAFTLPAFLSRAYRREFMPSEESIGIVPAAGYIDKSRSASILSMRYLDYLNEERDSLSQIVHAGNSGRGECVVGGLRVDGLVEVGGIKHVWEIQGCFFHSHMGRGGCKNRLTGRAHPMFGVTWDERHQQSLFRLQQLEKMEGVEVHVVYECQIEKRLVEDPQFKLWWENPRNRKKYLLRVSPRDAVFGGRTELYVSIVELTADLIRAGWRLRYVDVRSLYPFVMAMCEFPATPHPEIIDDRATLDSLSGKRLVDEYFGLVHCSILPPRGLALPVLPMRARGKTVFALCRSCSLENRQNEMCIHAPEDRELEGLYTTPELRLALLMDYEITFVWHIQHYAKRTTELFKSYVARMMGFKVINGGWPVEGEQARREYLDFYRTVLGLAIDPEQIRRDDALYTTAKIMLNCLWGKLAQNPDVLRTEFITEYDQMARLLNDTTKQPTYLQGASNHVQAISYRDHQDYVKESSFYNTTIAAFVTAHARVHMYTTCLAPLGDRLVYTDTDSAVYLENVRKGPMLDVGQCLGELASELGPWEFISDWRGVAPKTYRYETRKEESPWRIEGVAQRSKGVCLNSSFAGQLDRDCWTSLILKTAHECAPAFYNSMVEAGSDDPETAAAASNASAVYDALPPDQRRSTFVLPQPTLARNQLRPGIWNRPNETKGIQYVNDKRRLRADAEPPATAPEGPAFILNTFLFGYWQSG